MNAKKELIKQLEDLSIDDTSHPEFYSGYNHAISDAIELVEKSNKLNLHNVIDFKNYDKKDLNRTQLLRYKYIVKELHQLDFIRHRTYTDCIEEIEDWLIIKE